MKIQMYNEISEKCLIGSVFLRPECFTQIRAELEPKDFWNERHQVLFKTFIETADNGSPIDVLVVSNELEKKGALAKAGGRDYLVDLVDQIAISAGVQYHIEAVKEARVTRDLMELSDKIQIDLKSMMPVSEILSSLRNSIIKMNVGTKVDVIPLSNALKETIDRLEILSKADGKLRGIPSGFIDVDHFTAGWQPGELIVIAGRPAMGKSVIAKDLAEASTVPVAYFSLEMSVNELIKRQLAGRSKVNFETLRTARINDEDWAEIIKGAGRLARMEINYIDTGSLTIDQIVAISENLKMTEDIGLVIIDYLQLITTKYRLEIREREVAEISRKLKVLARSLGIPIICLAQLNRQCELRNDKRPKLSDLRESGAIEQDADVVAFIYREYMYNRQAPKYDAELIIAKGRNIRTGIIRLHFDGAHQTFRDAIKS